MRLRKVLFILFVFFLYGQIVTVNASAEGAVSSLLDTQRDRFTQEDRERLIRLEVIMKEFKESVDKRFEQVDKRFIELREDMNKRFEQVDKRFEQMMTFLWILVTIFVALTVSNIGFTTHHKSPPNHPNLL